MGIVKLDLIRSLGNFKNKEMNMRDIEHHLFW
jgi:hypothetical protein